MQYKCGVWVPPNEPIDYPFHPLALYEVNHHTQVVARVLEAPITVPQGKPVARDATRGFDSSSTSDFCNGSLSLAMLSGGSS